MADSWLELESQEALPARDMQFQIQREACGRIRGSSVTRDAADTRLGKWLHEFRESGGGFVVRARIAARAPGLNPCCSPLPDIGLDEEAESQYPGVREVM